MKNGHKAKIRTSLKRCLSFLLVFAMLLTMTPIESYAAESDGTTEETVTTEAATEENDTDEATTETSTETDTEASTEDKTVESSETTTEAKVETPTETTEAVTEAPAEEIIPETPAIEETSEALVGSGAVIEEEELDSKLATSSIGNIVLAGTSRNMWHWKLNGRDVFCLSHGSHMSAGYPVHEGDFIPTVNLPD